MAGSSEEFYALVLQWLQQHGKPLASAVTGVTGHGSSWEGDTENGFYDTFTVTITFLLSHDQSATPHEETVTGEEAVSLWAHVVNAAWPASFVNES